MLSDEKTISKYIKYLEKEFILKQNYLNDIEHIFIGGGTPSAIGLDNLNVLFQTIKKYINMEKIKEFSIECNPKDISNEMLTLFNSNNINRISLGVQSLNKRKLKLLNRNHTKKDIIKALKIINDNKINNVNIDLMYGLPGDSFYKIKNDINTLKRFKNTHFSCYSLILEKKTMLYHKFQKGDFKPFDEDKEAKIYYKIQKYLNKNGYKQYETSNFCIPGYECQYNVNTWKNGRYLGIGANASYYIDNIRYTNIRNIKKYFEYLDNISTELYCEKYIVDKETEMYEEIMLGLRLKDGINIDEFNIKYNLDLFDEFKNINFLLKNNLLIFKDKRIFIPDDKMYIANSIINKILD